MRRIFKARVLAVLLAAGAALLAPTSPRADWLPLLMSPEEEARVGKEQHAKIVAEFGGVYNDEAVARYVASVGALLARSSDQPNASYTVTVLNSPIVNAFALPGGYVYVTRGLLALADNEAELAGVLAHEIGHVTARHAAQRYSQSVFAQLGLGLLSVFTRSDLVSQMAGLTADLVLKSYSREQETEADTLGIRFMSRAGFDPHAMSSFLTKLEAHDSLQAEITGRKGGIDQLSLLSTHPRTADRVERTIAEAGAIQVRDPMVARDIYLRKIDGMLYGDDPEQGIVLGRRFVHPKLRFQFEAPPGFRLINSEKAVLGINPEGAQMEFTFARREPGQRMTGYLVSDWARGVTLRDVEAIDVGGLEAATGWTRVSSQRGRLDARLIAIAFDSATAARFLFVTPPQLGAQLNEKLRRTTYSFRRLSPGEAAQVRPLRVRIAAVGAGETVASLARRQPFESHSEQRLRVLNGLPAGAEPAPGSLIKLVTE